MITVYTISLHDFIEATLGRLQVENFDEIQTEFFDLVDMDKAEFENQKTLAQLKMTLRIIDEGLLIMRRKYIQWVAEELALQGYPDDYENDRDNACNRTHSLSRTLLFEISTLEDNGTKAGKQLTEQDFNEAIAELSKHQGYKIDRHTTTAAEYAAILKNHYNELKANARRDHTTDN